MLGFSIAIYLKNKSEFNIEFNESDIIQKAVHPGGEFIARKLFNNIDYFELESENKEILLAYFKPSTEYLIKKHFINGVSNLSKFLQIDFELFRNILSDNYFLLQPECCRIIALCQSKNSLFELILHFFSDQPPIYKGFIVDSIGSFVFDNYKASERFELDSIQILYKDNAEGEISIRVLETIARIKNEFINNIPSPVDNFTKIDSYNECIYYESDKNKNEYLEIIPYRKFQFDDADSFGSFKKSILQASDFEIIGNVRIDYKSFFKSVLITYDLPEEKYSFGLQIFDWKKSRDCFSAILLINNLYKKAFKFFEIFSRFPIISSKNLRIINDEYDIIFLKYGLTLQERYFIKDSSIDNNNAGSISKNIYLFVFDLFFKEKGQWDEFEKTSKKDISLFLSYILKRLRSGMVSVGRINFMCEKIKDIGYSSDFEICNFYYSERLRIKIFDTTRKEINWRGIANSLKNLFEEFAIIFEGLDVKNLTYVNKLIFNKDIPSRLHYLSRELINLNLNVSELVPELSQEPPINLFKTISTFSVFSIEFLSICKMLMVDKTPMSFISQGTNRLSFENGFYSISKKDSENINKLIRIYNSNENDLFNESVYFSLKEIGILCVLKVSEINYSDGLLILSPKSPFNDFEFDNFLTLFLKDVPEVENTVYLIIENVNLLFSRNLLFPPISSPDFDVISKTTMACLSEFNKLGRKYFAKRYKKRRFIINSFRRSIKIKRWFKRDLNVQESLLKGLPLTSTSPSHSSIVSYDIIKSEVINVVIPNERILNFFYKLRSDKSFKRRVLNLYSGKVILLIDLGIFIFLFWLLGKVTFQYDHKSTSFFRSYLWVTRVIIGIPFFVFHRKDIRS